VPILDSANLAIHEAGHPIVGLLGGRLMVYGGTLFQLLFPALVAFHFLRRGGAVGLAFGLVWLGENLLNVMRYMADARAHLQPRAEQAARCAVERGLRAPFLRPARARSC